MKTTFHLMTYQTPTVLTAWWTVLEAVKYVSNAGRHQWKLYLWCSLEPMGFLDSMGGSRHQGQWILLVLPCSSKTLKPDLVSFREENHGIFLIQFCLIVAKGFSQEDWKSCNYLTCTGNKDNERISYIHKHHSYLLEILLSII